ncbi:MAG: 30S ribosomal protein S7 [Patescibacteria group bacterium]|jgi:small subunit ribosomal protein S7
MARSKQKIAKHFEPDQKYGNILIGRLISKIMLNGKRTVAERIVYQALDAASKKLGKEPVEVFETVMHNISPSVQLKARRMGGSNLQVPTEVSADRRIVIAMKWLVQVSRGIKGKPMKDRLTQELIDAYNGTGNTMRKKEETHRMAEANQAFAHFSKF